MSFYHYPHIHTCLKATSVKNKENRVFKFWSLLLIGGIFEAYLSPTKCAFKKFYKLNHILPSFSVMWTKKSTGLNDPKVKQWNYLVTITYNKPEHVRDQRQQQRSYCKKRNTVGKQSVFPTKIGKKNLLLLGPIFFCFWFCWPHFFYFCFCRFLVFFPDLLVVLAFLLVLPFFAGFAIRKIYKILLLESKLYKILYWNRNVTKKFLGILLEVREGQKNDS